MKMKNWLIIHLGLGVALFSSCKKNEQEIAPETLAVVRNPAIVAHYKNVTREEFYKNAFIIALDKKTHAAKDTFYRLSPTDPFSVKIDEMGLEQMRNQSNELKDFDYVLHFAGKYDTISNVSYQQYTQRVDCQSCSVEKQQLVMLTDYKNMTYTYQGKTYTEQDSLIISK